LGPFPKAFGGHGLSKLTRLRPFASFGDAFGRGRILKLARLRLFTLLDDAFAGGGSLFAPA
jgi:hypothetical protein